MSIIHFGSFSGYITLIEDFPISPNDECIGCYKFISIQNEDGNVVNFVAGPDTYFLNHEMIHVGERITGYFDADTPAILIYPPQYRALIIVKDSPYTQIKVDYFDENLLSSDGNLKLNIAPDTPILLTNGQAFNRNPARQNLIVSYGATTMSIPAQTTPFEIIVICCTM